LHLHLHLLLLLLLLRLLRLHRRSSLANWNHCLGCSTISPVGRRAARKRLAIPRRPCRWCFLLNHEHKRLGKLPANPRLLLLLLRLRLSP
jgi:hypothetical protein